MMGIAVDISRCRREQIMGRRDDRKRFCDMVSNE